MYKYITNNYRRYFTISSGYEVKYFYNAVIKKHKPKQQIKSKPTVKQNKNKR